MAFSKLILSQAVTVAKKSGKLQTSVDELKTKLISEVETKITEKVPVPLPFSLTDAIKGDINLTENPKKYLKQLPKIPDPLKEQANQMLDELEESLNSTIKKKNNFQSGINTLTIPLNTINTLGGTLNGITTTVGTTIKILKAIPLPTVLAPGVGIPSSLIVGFGDGLAKAKDVVSVVDGAVSIIPKMTSQILDLLGKVNGALSALDLIFIPTTVLISFLRTFINFGPDATDEQFEKVLKTSINNTINSLPLTGLSSDFNTNQLQDGELEERLRPNSTNPIFHRGYRLTLQYDDKNKFSFPSRRIKGHNTLTSISPSIYHLPTDSYSYSTSLQVMVGELKNRIDNTLLPPPTSKYLEIKA